MKLHPSISNALRAAVLLGVLGPGCSQIRALASRSSLANLYSCPGYESLQTATRYSASGSGTALDPYLICTPEQLADIGANPGAWTESFTLVSDIDLAGYYAVGGAAFQIGSCGSGTCADADPAEISYAGTFDGNGYAIRNFRFLAVLQNGVGLFGRLSGTVQNLSIEDGNVEGAGYVGIAIGYGVTGCTHSGLSTSGTARGTTNVGGAIGRTVCPLTASHSSASVIASGDYAGGLGGYVQATPAVSGLYATGDVASGGIAAGGLFGYLHNSVTDSYATGNVTGVGYVGGLVGDSRVRGGSTRCHATGNVVSTGDYVGGLFGRDGTGSINASYATGNVVSTGDYVGGLVGYTISVIQDSYALGDVSGDASVGGLAGYVFSDVDQSFSAGAVVGTGALVGGLVGELTGTVNDAFSISSVSGPSSTGRLFPNNAGTGVDAYVWSGSACSGSCDANESGTAAAIADFYDPMNNPLSVWNITVWETHVGSLPTLF